MSLDILQFLQLVGQLNFLSWFVFTMFNKSKDRDNVSLICQIDRFSNLSVIALQKHV